MTWRDIAGPDGSRQRTRRGVLASLGTTGTIALAGCLGDDDDPAGDGVEQETDTLTVGLAIPESGPLGNEGDDLVAGYQLAASHINEGEGPAVDGPWDDISEDGGVLGEQLELVIEDTGSSYDGARDAAQTLVHAHDAAMLTGGASRAEARGHLEVAQEQAVVYMSGYTPTGAVSGQDCNRFGFNEAPTPQMVANALGPVLGEELGTDEEVAFTQLSPDSDWGDEMEDAMSVLEDVGADWLHQSRSNVTTRVGAQSYEGHVEDILEVESDFMVVNLTGLDGANALRELQRQLPAGHDVTIVVPFIDRVLAANAGGSLRGVIGTRHWTQNLEDYFSESFEDSWLGTAGDPRAPENPSEIAHLAYVQLCQWAAAVERAGSLDADAVIAELEGYQYNVGLGNAVLRDCDHQAIRDVPVVRGAEDFGEDGLVEADDDPEEGEDEPDDEEKADDGEGEDDDAAADDEAEANDAEEPDDDEEVDDGEVEDDEAADDSEPDDDVPDDEPPEPGEEEEIEEDDFELVTLAGDVGYGCDQPPASDCTL